MYKLRIPIKKLLVLRKNSILPNSENSKGKFFKRKKKMSTQNNGQPNETKFNLVEKKKRRMRTGKKNGPQETFIFHLKLEEQKKSKKQKTQNNPQPKSPTSTKPEPINQVQKQQFIPNYLPQPFQKEELTPTLDEISLKLETEFKSNSKLDSYISGLEKTNEPLFVSLLDGCILKVNSVFTKLIEYTSEEMESTMIQNIIHPDDKNQANILILQMLSTNSDSVTHDVRYMTPFGRVILCVQEVTAIRNQYQSVQWLSYKILSSKQLEEIVRGDRIGVQSCVCDHKSQYYMDEKYESFEELFCMSLERFFYISQPCCFYDHSGLILWNNDSFDQLFGGKERQFVNKKTSEIEAIKGTAMDILAKSVLEEQPEKLECQFVPQSNLITKKMSVKCSGYKFEQSDSSLFGYLWVFEILDPEESYQSDNMLLKEDLKL